MPHRTPFGFLKGEPKKASPSRASNVTDESVSGDLADSDDEPRETSISHSTQDSNENTDNGGLKYVLP